MLTDPSFFQNELLGYVTKRVKDKAAAEDIVHDVFLKVHAKSAQLKDDEKIFPWIYRIAANTITDYFRSKSRTVDRLDLDLENENRYLNHCVERCLTEQLAALPAKYREALVLSELQGLSQLELARRLNISYSGAKSRVQRARLMLRQTMERSYNVKFDSYGNVTRCEARVACNC
jgi:RNA polymerase sigma-70 factor (ECF subfamily)